MKKARIIGTGSYLPEKVLTNVDLEKFLDTTDEWIVTRTGIRERHIAAEGEMTSDLATNARGGPWRWPASAPEELDLIIVGTITGDFPWPATACLVQHKLGATRAGGFRCLRGLQRVSLCSGQRRQAHQPGPARKALVIGAEILSRIVDWQDRNTCVLFGDGAGAVVLEAQEGDRGVLSTHLHSDGAFWELLYQPGFGSRYPASEAGIKERLPVS